MMLMTNNRFLPENISIAAFRGLWDRIAKPNSIEAFKRASIKGIPFLIDLTINHHMDRAQLMQECLFERYSVPVFVKVQAISMDYLPFIHKNPASKIYWIEASSNSAGLFNVYALEGKQNFVRYGSYLPINNIKKFNRNHKHISLQEKKNDKNKFVMFESIDTLCSISEIREYGKIGDSLTIKTLMNTFGSDTPIIQVSDLVERTLLIYQMKG